jgi:hypothetical protein
MFTDVSVLRVLYKVRTNADVKTFYVLITIFSSYLFPRHIQTPGLAKTGANTATCVFFFIFKVFAVSDLF